MRSNHKLSLKTHVETYVDARCEQSCIELCICDHHQSEQMLISGLSEVKMRTQI